jgi:hypothetical protein
VEQQRAHEQDVVCFEDAWNFVSLYLPSLDGCRVEPAAAMRSGQHAQGTIVRTTVVEVHPHRQHPLEYGNRRLDVYDPLLLRPSSKAGDALAVANGDRQVLVPGNLPVSLGRFIEQRRLDGKASWAENRFHERSNRRGPRK